MTPDEAYVLEVAERLLSITDPFAKDKVGYTFPDAWLFRDLLNREFGRREILTERNIEWIRRQLLKYQNQIMLLGFDYSRLEKIRIFEYAAYWKTNMANAKIASVKITIKPFQAIPAVLEADDETLKQIAKLPKRVMVVATYRVFGQRPQEHAYAEFTHEQFAKITSGILGSTFSNTGVAEMEVVYVASQMFLNMLCNQIGFPRELPK